jgi:hypothetical protein
MTTPAAGHPSPARPQPAITHHRCQLKTVCVPFMALKGDSYRLKNRDLGRAPAAAADES